MEYAGNLLAAKNPLLVGSLTVPVSAVQSVPLLNARHCCIGPLPGFVQILNVAQHRTVVDHHDIVKHKYAQHSVLAKYSLFRNSLRFQTEPDLS